MVKTVFLLGISRRSGTNFLHDLLCAHPSCGTVFPVREDFLVAEANHLVKFVDSVADRWDPEWGHHRTVRTKLLRHIGIGLNQFLGSLTQSSWNDQKWPDKLSSERRFLKTDPEITVTKTPSVENLNLRSLVPDSKTIVIVRDGRSVAESTVRGLNGNFEATIRNWVSSAKKILEAKKENDDFVVVRYEDLITNQISELEKIFSFLELDKSQYDFGAATGMPVRGSSFQRGGEDQVHWGQVEKTKNFKPLERWSGWSRLKHERFNWIGANTLQELGYQPKIYSRINPVFITYNILFDIFYYVRCSVSFIIKKSRFFVSGSNVAPNLYIE